MGVPGDLQETTPEPTDASVYLEDRPAMRFVTKQFSGFPDELDWTMQAAELYELATAAGLQPKTEPHWTAGYDGPSGETKFGWSLTPTFELANVVDQKAL